MITAKKRKQLMGKARMQKARLHLGMNGVTHAVVLAMRKAFEGMCTHPEPTDVVRVKIHSTYEGDIDADIELLEKSSECEFVGMDGIFMVFWKEGNA